MHYIMDKPLEQQPRRQKLKLTGSQISRAHRPIGSLSHTSLTLEPGQQNIQILTGTEIQILSEEKERINMNHIKAKSSSFHVLQFPLQSKDCLNCTETKLEQNIILPYSQWVICQKKQTTRWATLRDFQVQDSFFLTNPSAFDLLTPTYCS